jgi:hypothetical protein
MTVGDTVLLIMDLPEHIQSKSDKPNNPKCHQKGHSQYKLHQNKPAIWGGKGGLTEKLI